MVENVIIYQNSDLHTEIYAAIPHGPETGEIQRVSELHALTPYGMLLVSLGTCTGIVLHTYAQNHGLNLARVGLHLRYDRVFQEDCDNCEQIERYQERFEEEIVLMGDLSKREREKLFHIAHQCPVYKILQDGATVSSRLTEKAEVPS